jgi:hypothetical protein
MLSRERFLVSRRLVGRYGIWEERKWMDSRAIEGL